MRLIEQAEQTVRARASWPVGSLLDMLSPDGRSTLLKLGVRHQFANGDILIREQEESSHVILLCQAVVKITASLENGRTALLGIKVSGDVVGEMAALCGNPRCATVTACGSANVRILSKDDFCRFLQDYPDAHFALTRMIMQRLRWADQRRVDFNGYPTIIRLARVLDELAGSYGRRDHDGVVFDVGLTQRELGALVGAEEDTARKELRKLKDEGVIRVGYRSITVLDQAMLTKIAYEHD
jgi:CRP-like cAMP-binding protein